jgi:hypothetical protein
MSLRSAWAEPAPVESRETVIAIGDVHGDFDDFVAILQRTGLIDKQNHWTGGKATFVQVGDLLDRGPKPRQVMDIMMSLEKEAVQAGGQVIALIGNHEMMNIMGDLRYVTPANFASFADNDSEKRQKAAYQEYLKWRENHPSLIAELTQPMELTEPEWMARHPPGFVEQREALSPHGEYGKWLRGKSAVAEMNGIVFLHGGISPDVAKIKIAGINSQIRNEIKEFDAAKEYLQNEKLILPFFNLQEIASVLQAEVIAERKSNVPSNDQRQAKILEFLKFNDWLSVKEDGPLWFRGYDRWTDEQGTPQTAKILEAYQAKHIVVGHTVQKGGRIRPRFGDEVFLIDSGMLSSYYPGGHPSALGICGNGKFLAVYLDQPVLLLDSAQPSTKGDGSGGHAEVAGAPTVAGDLTVLTPDRMCSATTATLQ